MLSIGLVRLKRPFCGWLQHGPTLNNIRNRTKQQFFLIWTFSKIQTFSKMNNLKIAVFIIKKNDLIFLTF
jgi:hypothetical protein